MAFYDRVRELGELDKLASRFSTVIVYGPRGVGKSELTRYWIDKRRVTSLYVYAREQRVLVSSVAERALGRGTAARLASIFMEAEPGLRTLLKLVEALQEAVASATRALGRRILYLVLDEFHLLSGYREASEALRDLESLSAMLVKGEIRGMRVVLTVSEGFFATTRAISRFRGYGAAYMLVEGLDCSHYMALLDEYAEKNPSCRGLDRMELVAVTGTAPGYVPEACSYLGDPALRQRYIAGLVAELEQALARIARSLGLGRDEVIELARRALAEPVQPLRDPVLAELGEKLVEDNIAYPVLRGGGIEYRPQLPLYRAVIEETSRRHAESLLGLGIETVIEAAKEVSPCRS